MTKALDIRDVALIDGFSVYSCGKTVLNIGCGEGRLDFHLVEMGYGKYNYLITVDKRQCYG